MPNRNPFTIRTEALIKGLDHDRQLKDNPSLKEQIANVLRGRLKVTERTNKKQPKPEPEKTQVEKIRERNRYIT